MENYQQIEKKLHTAHAEIEQLKGQVRALTDSLLNTTKALTESYKELAASKAPVLTVREYQDPQEKVAVMMTAFGQPIRFSPTMPEDKQERELRAWLVLEEALEFVEAMGFGWEVDGEAFTLIEGNGPDLVKAADAVGDLLVVTYGGANSLGIKAHEIFEEVHSSNMTKVQPDGTVQRREGDGKVVKPEGYRPPNIEGVLVKQVFENKG